jgi:hypothetical protein
MWPGPRDVHAMAIADLVSTLAKHEVEFIIVGGWPPSCAERP